MVRRWAHSAQRAKERWHISDRVSSEFCGFKNADLLLDDEEIPKEGLLEYVLEPSKTSNGSNADEGVIVLCVDVSGSMMVSEEVQELQGTCMTRNAHCSLTYTYNSGMETLARWGVE